MHLIFILSHPGEVVNAKRFDYVGCSRYSCLLCSRFLHFFQALETRRCHGKLYNHSWTVPLEDDLGTDLQSMLSGAVIEVILWMRKELIASKMLPAQKRVEAKESTIGDSLTAILRTSQENHQQSYAAIEHLQRQRAQSSHLQLKQEKCASSFNFSSLPLTIAEVC